MRGRPFRTPAVVLAIALSLAAPAAAAGPSVFDDYAPDGAIDPCKHSKAQLQKALDTVPPDVEQYAADYPAAIEDALEARARGDCGGGPATSGTGGGGADDGGAAPATGGTPAAPDGAPAAPAPAGDPAAAPAPTADPAATGGEVVPPPPAPTGATPAPAAVPDAELERVAGRTAGSDAPLPVVLLGALAAAVALAVLCGLAMRRLGLGGDRLEPVAHAWREAAWRAGGTWADFRDWVRLGR